MTARVSNDIAPDQVMSSHDIHLDSYNSHQLLSNLVISL